jgi:cyclase
MDVVQWAQRGVELGAGEILLTSVDQEGTRMGFDLDLIRAVTAKVSIPVIASGGMGVPEHMLPAVLEAEADAVAMADILHYKRATVGDVRRVAQQAGIKVRSFADG